MMTRMQSKHSAKASSNMKATYYHKYDLAPLHFSEAAMELISGWAKHVWEVVMDDGAIIYATYVPEASYYSRWQSSLPGNRRGDDRYNAGLPPAVRDLIKREHRAR